MRAVGPGTPAILPTKATDDPIRPAYDAGDVQAYIRDHPPSWPGYTEPWTIMDVWFNHVSNQCLDFPEKERLDPDSLLCLAEVSGTSPDPVADTYTFIRLIFDGHTGNFITQVKHQIEDADPPWERLVREKPHLTSEFVDFYRQGYHPAREGSYAAQFGAKWEWKPPTQYIITEQCALPIVPHMNLDNPYLNVPLYTEEDAIRFVTASVESGMFCWMHRPGLSVTASFTTDEHAPHTCGKVGRATLCAWVVEVRGVFSVSLPRGRSPSNIVRVVLDGRDGHYLCASPGIE